MPGLDRPSLAIACGLLAVGWLATRSRITRLVGLTSLALGIWPAATHLTAVDAALVAEARQEETRLVRCLGTSPDAGDDRHQAFHLALVAAERTRGIVCPSRRVFLGAAFDLPLALQSLPYATLVFEARQAAATEPAALANAGLDVCDYLVVTRAELETTRGSRLLHVASVRPWVEVAEGGGFVAFATAATTGASK